MSNKWTRYALWFCFTLALLASWSHVKWAFEALETDNVWVPWVAATAVDGGLFALAYSIQQRRRAKRGTFWLWVGVAAFAGISMLANWLHAQVVLHGDAFLATDKIGNIMSFAFSGVLPLLVVYLGEIVSADDAVIVAQREKSEKSKQKADNRLKQKIEELEQRIKEMGDINEELEQRVKSQSQGVSELEALLNDLNPKAKHSLLYVAGTYNNMEDAATEAGCSKATISRMVKNLNGVTGV